MDSSSSLDFVQAIFIKLAENQGIPLGELKGYEKNEPFSKWNLNYQGSLQQDVERGIQKMLHCFELHQTAIEQEDKVTAKCGLACAAIFAQTLENVFRDIQSECYKVLENDKRFTWPEIPEGYQIPESYDCIRVLKT